MGEKEASQSEALANSGPLEAPSPWRANLRTRVVKHGIRLVCGTPDFVPATAARDVPLISAGLRLGWLRGLQCLGLEHFVAKSGLGHRFLCHVGDLSEYPFYHRRAYQKELTLCVGWLMDTEKPTVYDLGANVGFVSSHLAQMLAARSPQIFAFEPVPTTFSKLEISVRRLQLRDMIHPIPLAVSDSGRPLRLAYSPGNSLVSHVLRDQHELQPQLEEMVCVPATSLDAFVAEAGTTPHLLKIDIEGSEVAALRGAQALLSGEDRPSILLEFNPVTLREHGNSPQELGKLLSGYELYYVDDLQAQMLPFGSSIPDLGRINWICNIFAAPRGRANGGRVHSAFQFARHHLR
jgi:FkbM family methyltransferase